METVKSSDDSRKLAGMVPTWRGAVVRSRHGKWDRGAVADLAFLEEGEVDDIPYDAFTLNTHTNYKWMQWRHWTETRDHAAIL